MRYVERLKSKRGISHAARYEPGRPLDGLLAVARRVDREVSVAEVPELRVLAVRFRNSSDDHMANTTYEVVEAGGYLVYSETFDLLYSCDSESFERDYERAEG